MVTKALGVLPENMGEWELEWAVECPKNRKKMIENGSCANNGPIIARS